MKYLLLKPSLNAGLGDLIRALIQAVSYAKLSDRILCVDWKGGMYGMPENVNLFDRIFEINDIPYVQEIPDGLSVYPSTWENSTYKTIEQVRIENNDPGGNRQRSIKRYSFDVSKFDYQEDILVMWDFDQFEALVNPLIEKGIINKTQSDYHALAMGKIFNRYLALREEPLNYFEENWRKIIKNTRNTKLIGVHIRETKESLDDFGLLRRKSYFQAVDSILKRDPYASTIYLATDNEDVQNDFNFRYGNKLKVLFKQKWFKSPGEPIHLSLDACPDKWENILDALFDMFALSRCDYLIHRRASSFSRVSRAIGMYKDENVISFKKEILLKQKVINKLRMLRNDFLYNLKR